MKEETNCFVFKDFVKDKKILSETLKEFVNPATKLLR